MALGRSRALDTCPSLPTSPRRMSTVVFKRPAEEEEESEDEGTLQRRAFPLVDGHLGDQSVPPADGAEYLRRVRRQQQELGQQHQHLAHGHLKE